MTEELVESAAARDRLLLFQVLQPHDARTLSTLVRLIVPHQQPRLEPAQEASALAIDAQLVGNLELRQVILSGLHDLDKSAGAHGGESFHLLARTAQLEVLDAQEATPFFQTLVHSVKYDFYNRHLVWDVLGYPDLGNEAGYLDAGFDALDLQPVRR